MHFPECAHIGEGHDAIEELLDPIVSFLKLLLQIRVLGESYRQSLIKGSLPEHGLLRSGFFGCLLLGLLDSSFLLGQFALSPVERGLLLATDTTINDVLLGFLGHHSAPQI